MLQVCFVVRLSITLCLDFACGFLLLIFNYYYYYYYRGRFSVVRRCTDLQSGSEVAAKFINKSLVTKSSVMTEVNIMRNLKHVVLIQPTQVYETHSAFVIVMPLLVDLRRNVIGIVMT